MADIHRGQVSTKIVRAAGLQPGADAIPKRLGEVVLPVLVVNEDPEKFIVRRGIATDTTSVTIFTTPTDRDFFIMSAAVSTAHSVLSVSTFTAVQFVPRNGLATNALEIRTEPLTALQEHNSISFPEPILLNRGSAIVIVNSSGTPSIDSVGTIMGFTRDVSDL